jgi:hypothetical protein
MLSHAEARDVLSRAFAAREIKPSRHELQAVQAIGHLESSYGSTANNWGSVQVGHGPPCGDDSVELTDTHEDGTPYQWCYRAYSTPQAGAEGLIKELYRRKGVPDALRTGSGREIARAMRATGYFEAPAELYGKGIEARGLLISKALSEPFLLGANSTSSSGGLAFLGLGVVALGLGLSYRRGRN